MFRWILCAALVLAAAASAVPADAQPSSPDLAEAASLYRSAEQAMADKRYDDAARDYGAAYEISKDAILFFKIASALDKGGKCPVAITYYRRYLREGKPSAEHQKLTGERIAACESRASASPPPSSAPPSNPPPSNDKAPATPAAPTESDKGNDKSSDKGNDKTSDKGSDKAKSPAAPTAPPAPSGSEAKAPAKTGDKTGDKTTDKTTDKPGASNKAPDKKAGGSTGAAGATSAAPLSPNAPTAPTAPASAELAAAAPSSDDPAAASSSSDGLSTAPAAAPAAAATEPAAAIDEPTSELANLPEPTTPDNAFTAPASDGAAPSYPPPSPRRTGAWLAVGAGIAFATVGTVLALSAESTEDDIADLYLTRAGEDPQEFDRATQDRYDTLVERGDRYQLLSWVSFGAAAATAGVATYLFLTSSSSSGERAEEPKALALRPLLSRQGAGVGASWAF